eukprot:g2804.t1
MLGAQVELMKQRDIERRMSQAAVSNERHSKMVNDTKERHLKEQLARRDEFADFDAKIRRLREATAAEMRVVEDLSARLRLQKEEEERRKQSEELEQRQRELDDMWAKQQADGAARFEAERNRLEDDEEEWRKQIEAEIRKEIADKKAAGHSFVEGGAGAPAAAAPDAGAAVAPQAEAGTGAEAEAEAEAEAGEAAQAAAADPHGIGHDTVSPPNESDLEVLGAILNFIQHDEDRFTREFKETDEKGDGNGSFDVKEFHRFLEQVCGLQLTEIETARAFHVIDKDGGGSISEAELRDGIAETRAQIYKELGREPEPPKPMAVRGPPKNPPVDDTSDEEDEEDGDAGETEKTKEEVGGGADGDGDGDVDGDGEKGKKEEKDNDI